MSATEIQELAEAVLEQTVNPVAHREFTGTVTATEGRTVDVRIVPYGEIISHNDGLGGVPVGVEYREQIMPGWVNHQLNAANRVHANVEHEQGVNAKVGHGIALREEPDGTHGSFKLLETPAGETALQLIKAGSLDTVSFEAKFRKSVKTAAGVVQRVKADLVGVAFTRFGAYSGARVLGVREGDEFADEIIDEEFLPVPLDPELVKRCQALGVALPDRYTAHPAETDTPAEAGTSADGTRQTDVPSSEE